MAGAAVMLAGCWNLATINVAVRQYENRSARVFSIDAPHTEKPPEHVSWAAAMALRYRGQAAFRSTGSVQMIPCSAPKA